jgi:XTP/dITP diphosphohydrolase
MDPLVIATGNPHKVDELRAIFAEHALPVVGLRDLPGSENLREPDEPGGTFEENAAIKARSYAAQTGRICLADDSGLEIDALGGAPGVISSHYCSDGREVGMPRAERDRLNNGRVLKELESVPASERAARFVCVMVVARPDGRIIATTHGKFEGRIGAPPRVPAGTAGFGYDPLFLVAPQFERTSAELSVQEKNKLSHRSMAARAMAERLDGLA